MGSEKKCEKQEDYIEKGMKKALRKIQRSPLLQPSSEQ
jgi:hypothetical protein